VRVHRATRDDRFCRCRSEYSYCSAPTIELLSTPEINIFDRKVALNLPLNKRGCYAKFGSYKNRLRLIIHAFLNNNSNPPSNCFARISLLLNLVMSELRERDYYFCHSYHHRHPLYGIYLQ
jgi:hypothetical protein